MNMYFAALTGDLEQVKELVESGQDKNVTVVDGQTPLFAASQNGHLDVVRYLVSKVV